MAPLVRDPDVPYDECFDANDFFEPLEGPKVFPNDIVAHTLRFLATSQNQIVVRDLKTGHEANHQQLLSDIVHCRNEIRKRLDPQSVEDLRRDKEVCFCLWSSGYEFVVSFFAVLALGGIVASFSPHVAIAEAVYFADTVRAHAILVSSTHQAAAAQVAEKTKLGSQLKTIDTTPFLRSPVIDPRTFTTPSGRIRDQNKPAVIIFTSGSTGPPKAVAIRRQNVYTSAISFIRTQGITRESRIVQLLPTHHATGLFVNTLPGILGGGCVEFNQGSFDAAETWEQFRRGDLRNFSAVPTIYIRLLRHWENVISKMSEHERQMYRTGVSKILRFESSTSPLPLNVAKAWPKLTGTAIAERYGGSEFGNVYGHFAGVKIIPGSVGIKNPDVESKLSEGDRGEVLVRGAGLFAKYMYNVEATKSSFDSDGFYKTGDLARREGDYYYIEGRISVDIIKSGGYKISALDIEDAISTHPEVAEVVVVGMDDEDFGQRIAAAVVLKDPSKAMSIQRLREDLRNNLSNYKLPTILRIVPSLPRTSTMKVPKLLIKNDLFGTNHPEIQRWVRQASQTRL